jgi:hypothetical protein
MNPFHELNSNDLTPELIRSEIESRGYILIRDLIPKQDIQNLLGEITERMVSPGWLLAGHDPLQRVADPSIYSAAGVDSSAYIRVQSEVCSMHSLHSFMHHPALQRVMKMFVGPRVLIHPKAAARIIFPKVKRMTIRAHQDHQDPHVLGGDHECFTAWMPLHDCPLDMGCLRINEASHLYGLQDADPVSRYVLSNSMKGQGWAGSQMNAGDGLFFHSLTVHEALPNSSDQIRISAQIRFQDYERTINPANLIFTGEDGLSWDRIYEGWSDKKLAFYWQKCPLRLNPSKKNLQELASSAESPDMRAFYSKVLERFEPYWPDEVVG